MNDFFWHQDRAFLALTEKSLLTLGIIFAVMLAVTVWITVRSRNDSDDV